MKERFPWKWLLAGLVAVNLILYAYVALVPENTLMAWFDNDDAFFYFKVAQNITAGHGISFDGINLTNGFHPLWMAICIPIFWLARYDLILPLRVLVILSAMLSSGCGLLLFQLLRRQLSPEIALLPAVAVMFLPYVQVRIFEGGVESGLSAFLILLLLYLCVRWREAGTDTVRAILLGLVAGLTILARLDNIFLVLLLGLWYGLGFASARLRILVLADFFLIFVLGLLSYFAGLHLGMLSLPGAGSPLFLIGPAYIFIPLSLFLFGMYSPGGGVPSFRLAGKLFLSILIATSLQLAVLFLLRTTGIVPPFRWTLFLLYAGGMFVGACLSRWSSHALNSATLGEDANRVEISSRHFWRTFIGRCSTYFLPAVILLAVYMAWNLSYAGIAMPVSGLVKQWWGELYKYRYGSVMNRNLPMLLGDDAWGLALSPLKALADALAGPANTPVLAAIVGVVLAGLLAVIVIQRKFIIPNLDQAGLLPHFFGLYAQIFYYSATPYWNMRDWYWIGQMLFILILAGILLEALRLLPERPKQLPWRILSFGLTFVLLAVFAGTFLTRFPARSSVSSDIFHKGEAHFLEQNTEPDSLIGLPGGGMTGYFIQDRTIVNMDGLINSHAYFQALKQGTAGLYLEALGLDYVLIQQSELEQPPYSQMLAGRIEYLADYEDARLYRYLRVEQETP
jgi:hypothetical protein